MQISLKRVSEKEGDAKIRNAEIRNSNSLLMRYLVQQCSRTGHLMRNRLIRKTDWHLEGNRKSKGRHMIISVVSTLSPKRNPAWVSFPASHY